MSSKKVQNIRSQVLLKKQLMAFDPNLKELDLSGINLTELPVEIGQLKNLQYT